MKPIGTTLSILILAGGLASGVSAADNYIVKEQTGNNFCHMKLPAISERTLFTNHPTPKSATSADVIDYYGSCDESATSKDEIATQRVDERHHNPGFNLAERIESLSCYLKNAHHSAAQLIGRGPLQYRASCRRPDCVRGTDTDEEKERP